VIGRAARVLLALAAISCVPATTTLPPRAAAVAWRYEVQFRADAQLDVVATFSHGVDTALVASSTSVARFVESLFVAEPGGYREITREGAQWPLTCPAPCRVRYRFRLADAARELHDEDTALRVGAAFVAPPSTWLLRPPAVRDQSRYRFHVTMPPGQRFVTGIRAAASGSFEASTDRFAESSVAAFGQLSVHTLSDSGSTLVLAPLLELPEADLIAWAHRENAAIDVYFGARGAQPVLVLVLPGSYGETQGKALGGGGASVLLRLAKHSSTAALARDWTLPHELVHTRIPELSRSQRWLSEGIATYVEPLARMHAGVIPREKMWRDLIDGLPNGLPRPGDHGLDDAHSWGRVYWGGALYCFLADLAIRDRTHAARSLRDALRAVHASGGNVEKVWPLARLLDVADTATGTHAMRELYERLGRAPGSEDLERVWSQLGIARDGDSVRFDDRAPGAALRRSFDAR
jgi:hypothetical protein